MALQNETMRGFPFLQVMYNDEYYPPNQVDLGKSILLRLCAAIEEQKPASLDELYTLTHAATEEFNVLGEDLELETVARECIAADFKRIAKAYGFEDADTEELIAPRDW